MGEKGQVGTESQGNSNPLGECRPGFRLGGSWEYRPETSLQSGSESSWSPAQQENTASVGSLRGSKLLHPKWTDAQQGTALAQATISHMVLASWPGETPNGKLTAYPVSCAMQVQVTPHI